MTFDKTVKFLPIKKPKSHICTLEFMIFIHSFSLIDLIKQGKMLDQISQIFLRTHFPVMLNICCMQRDWVDGVNHYWNTEVSSRLSTKFVSYIVENTLKLNFAAVTVYLSQQKDIRIDARKKTPTFFENRILNFFYLEAWNSHRFRLLSVHLATFFFNCSLYPHFPTVFDFNFRSSEEIYQKLY